MVKVVALPPHLLVPLGQYLCGLSPALAASLPPTDPALGLLQLLLGPAVMARILHHLALGRDKEDLQADINTRLLTGDGQRLRWHIDTGEGHIPAVGVVGDGNRLDRAFDDALLRAARPVDSDPPDFGEDQAAIIQPRSVAKLLVREGVPPVAALEPRETGLLATLDPRKEGLVRFVEPRQHVLEHMGMESLELRERFANILQLGFLGVASN